MKRCIVALCALFAVLWFGAAKADAAAEFCPASVETIEPSGAAGVSSAEYSYELNAATSRTIADATLIADTDHGWYRWTVAGVVLPAAKATETTARKTYTIDFAQSDRLHVAFPEALLVRHAWITSARATDENVLGWEKRGEFACMVPAYSSRGAWTAELERPQSRRSIPPPRPLGAASSTPVGAAQAVPTAIPFDSIDCDVPFRQATVTAPQIPDYPDSQRGSGVSATSLVAVGINEKGDMIEASVYAGSNAAFDQSALRAARMSSYSAPISYCQKVRGLYLFTATFMPRY
jgi:TonB family protein